jgi:cellulose synthase/poly-beta-1,6-N-acetylglucosamine synthase-like glycosyltransferase
MYHGSVIAFLAADLVLLLLVIRWPLSRRFDESDTGDDRVVKLPPVRRPALPRALWFLCVAVAFSVLLVAFRHPRPYQAYYALVGYLLSAAHSGASVNPHGLPPLVPAAELCYLVAIAVTARATPGRRLMILAHAPLFVAVSALVESLAALISSAVGLPLGPVPVIVFFLQYTVGFLMLYRMSFTTFRLPRPTTLPIGRRGDWRDNLLLTLCAIGAVGIVGTLAVVLAGHARDEPAAVFIVLVSLRATVNDVMFLLLALIGRLGGRKPLLGAERPALEVIIPAFNEAVGIERLLRSIDRAAANYGGPVRVVMCDDGSTDDTRALAEAAIAAYEHATGEVIQGPHAGKAKALNLALSRCTSDYVYRVDADCALDQNAFVYSIPHFLADPRIGLVGALTLPKEPYVTWIDRMRGLEVLAIYGFSLPALAQVDAVPCVPGTFCAFRREPAVALGGFVTGMFGEDAEFTCALARLGWRVMLDPRITSYEDVPKSIRELRVQRYRWGLGGMMNFARYTPFGNGAPGPRFWFQLPKSMGTRFLSPMNFILITLTVLYAAFQPTVQHNIARFGLTFLLAQVPGMITRFCITAYYRRWRFLAWIPLWTAFMMLKRFFQLESVVGCGTRPVRPPLALRSRYPTWRAVLLALALVSTAGCAATTPSPGPTAASGTASATGSATGPLWIISGSTLTRLVSGDTGGSAAKYFNTPNAYVLTGAQHWSIPDGWSSTPTASFTSYATLRSALNNGTLDPRIKAVLYDNEHWSLTPGAEQSNPAHYDQLAAQLVHRHHLLFLAAPATDLVNVLSPATAAGNGHFQTFLDLGLAGDIARDADVIDIQAQGAEADTSLFASFVAGAAAQARKVNPNVKVLAGISTNPSGRTVTAAAIDHAAQAVRANVDGYWLNDPAASAACPACAGPYPQVALEALRGLGDAAG